MLYNQNPTELKYIESSYSVIHLNIVNSILNDNLHIEEIPKDKLTELQYCIFPGGNLIYHLLADKKKELHKLLDLTYPEFTTV